ncbi:MAG: cobalt-precorrin-5B (C(1))-methyltransferase CbiD, partial [Oceanidesulfovibrio sp.]
MKRGGKSLRTGFTTGTAAAAAAKAATLALLGCAPPDSVDTPLPSSWNKADAPPRLAIAIRECAAHAHGVRAGVVKDAGDDPDVTDGALIQAEVSHLEGPGLSEEATFHVEVTGGQGVGRATLPGLPVEPGQSAINPEPLRQIECAVREAVRESGKAVSGLIRVVVSVPEGERLAKKTLNPALGIVGGISILGTRGTVKPFSHEAYLATVRQGLDVARATGVREVVLATGGRSERFARTFWPAFAPTAFVQAGDLFAAGCEEAARRGFAKAF